MPNDSNSQMALARDGFFRLRCEAQLVTVAINVLNELPATQDHAVRKALALSVLGDSSGAAAKYASYLSLATNVMAFATTAGFDRGQVIVSTAAGDPDIFAQLTADWSKLAGV